MKFRKTKLPTDKTEIERDELPHLLKRMLGFGETLEKKKIKKNGNKLVPILTSTSEITLPIC